MKIIVLLVFSLFFNLLVTSHYVQANILEDAKEFNGHYYKIFEFIVKWDDAKKFCESVGGHLATAEDSSENAIIYEIIKNGSNNNYFLGGYKDNRGLWRWITEGVITDQNWHEIYNLNSHNKMIVVSYTNGKWQDASDKSSHGFICEWDSKDNAHDTTWRYRGE